MVLPPVAQAALAADEVLLGPRLPLRPAEKHGQQAHAVDARGPLGPRRLAERGEDIHRQGDLAGMAAGPDVPRPAGDGRHAQPAFIDVLFAAPPRPVVRPELNHSTVVRREEDQRVFGQLQPVERVEHPADARVHVLDQRDHFRALLAERRLAAFHLGEPLGRRLDGVVRRGVGEVEEEGPAGLGPLA